MAHYGVEVYRNLLSELGDKLHPSARHACNMWLQEAIDAAARGNDRHVIDRLKLVEDRVELELEWNSQR